MAFLKRKNLDKKKADNDTHSLLNSDDLLTYAINNSISISPLDVSSLTKKLGIMMRMEPMQGEESGSLKKGRDGQWIMTVNSLHHPHRQRFTIAHELGHYIKHTILQSDFEDKTFFRNEQSNRMETEANQFAAELLMPEKIFRSYLKNTSQKVEEIAEHFQVSSMAVRIRAKQLGYEGHNL